MLIQALARPDYQALKDVAVEWLLRSCAIAVYVYTLVGVYMNWSSNGHPWSLSALMLTETFTLLLIIAAIPARRRDASLLSILTVTYTSGFFVFLDSSDTVHLINDAAAASLQLLGLAITLAAKATLRRSFGILPAARSLVTIGPYRLVRHPMYFGYLAGNAGFFLGNASLRNAGLLTALMLVQVLRIGREEAIFLQSGLAADYAAYQRRVKFRLVPHVF